ncbi:MAG: prolyl oligopeptidase family serine peptidase [Pseudomonadota bacterium]
MKPIILISLFMLSVTAQSAERVEQGNLVLEDIPPPSERIAKQIARYSNTRSASLTGWLPDNQGMLIRTRFAETRQIHQVMQAGGTRRQLTFFAEPIGGAEVCDNAEQQGFLFTKDIGGNEFYQVFYFDQASGKSTLLTDGKSRHGNVLCANQGKKFTYFSTQRNGRDWDIMIGDLSNPGQAKMAAENKGAWFPVDWSPDDSKLIMEKYVSINESYYQILDVESGQRMPLNPDAGKVSYGYAVWAKDGKSLFLTSDEGSEFRQLRHYDLTNNSQQSLTPDINWDVASIKLSPQRDTLAFVVNAGGFNDLYLMDTTTLKYQQVKSLPQGQIYNLHFRPDGKALGLSMNTPQSSGDVYVLDLGTLQTTRWTYSEIGGLNEAQFVAPEIIQYPTFDQVNGQPRMIPAFYYKPANRKPPYPVLVSIHGGPESQYRPYFSSRFQFYLNELGIAVIAPNVRGSAGYGKTYVQLDNGYKREDSVKDIGGLLTWISQQSELDASKVAVYGGSYGGYMVLASMVHYGEKLACGIEAVGISNFVTFLENTQDYRRDLRRQEYGDESDPKMRKFLQKISPLTHVSKINKPMLVAQGLNDPRVPASESEQVVAGIRANGKKVWYMLAKDEGHGFAKKTNRDFYANVVAMFLEDCLLKSK